jgi:hypothetical protein
LIIAGVACALGQPARDRRPNSPAPGSDRSALETFNVAVPAHPFDLILVRPEANSIALSIVAYDEREGYVAYGGQPGAGTMQTPVRRFARGEAATVTLTGLEPDTRYYYQFRSRVVGADTFSSAPEASFHTARPPGATFTFTLTADAHLDGHTSPQVYRQTLGNIAASGADLHLDLGNLFMTDKHATRDEAAAQYLAQRYYLGLVGPSTPILLALGTHDGESAKDDDGTDASLAAWSHRMRTRLFPNPVPDDFYSGNATPDAARGLRQNYYAFTWGDALFVVLDPFANSARTRGSRDGWAWSLGVEQYRWLERTLRESRATFKFVFIHNLLCGDAAARGGVEVAMFNEWGGKNADGTDGFAQHRPGWAEPVHALLVRHRVAAVFKAHDNFYARQELDGIVYLMVPQPSFAGTDRIRDLENYGYKRGVFLGNSGHVRVTVSPAEVTIAYVKSSAAPEIADAATIQPRR